MRGVTLEPGCAWGLAKFAYTPRLHISLKINRLISGCLEELSRHKKTRVERVFCAGRAGIKLVGAIGIEPTTSTMSRWRSNQLSYAPVEAARIITATGRLCKHPVADRASLRAAEKIKYPNLLVLRCSCCVASRVA